VRKDSVYRKTKNEAKPITCKVTEFVPLTEIYFVCLYVWAIRGQEDKQKQGKQGKQGRKYFFISLTSSPDHLLGVGLVFPEGAAGTLGNTGEVPGLSGVTPWLV